MIYDFDKIIPRRGTDSLKWDFTTDNEVLPLWVADMDFRTAAPIVDALVKRAQHGIFGYSLFPDAYYAAIDSWFSRRYGFSVKKEWTLYANSVVPALSAIIRALTDAGDKVILQSPVYNCFYRDIGLNGCETVSNDLIYENGLYTIDFDGLERIAADPRAKLMLLCNPHNPAGRVWTRDELTRIGEICIRNQITVVSDEIHCDIVFSPHRHIPFASISEEFLLHSVTCTAPSKTFNLAGVHVSNTFVADAALRTKVEKAFHQNGIAEANAFAIDGLIAAYNEGEDWLQQMLAYLHDNYLALTDFFAENFPQLYVLPLEATYLVWLDCTALQRSSSELSQILLEKAKVRFNPGLMYGKNGENFLRINIACPRALLMEGLNRFRNCVLSL
ncbi:MAG: pyridoxal phosphate-dependent aminotransferase [Bacteroidales bacterium]|jgi:cystathionine beta-lyase|nr:pyridoxal phosphate-dependent aminotransferase [Bacteroidales bacterium]